MALPTYLRTPGAPTAIDTIVAHRRDGTPITAAERIVDAVRTGAYVETAAAMAGVSKVTLHEWLNKGAAANGKYAAGKRLGANEARYYSFANALVAAEAEAEVETIGTIALLARGGHEQVTKETRIAADGKVTEVTKTTTLPPNVTAATWHAERRWSHRWNRRTQIELTGAEGGPIKVESPLSALMVDLDAMERRTMAAPVIDVLEVPAPPEEAAS